MASPRYTFETSQLPQWDFVVKRDGLPVNYYSAPRGVVDQIVDHLNAGTVPFGTEVGEHVEHVRLNAERIDR